MLSYLIVNIASSALVLSYIRCDRGTVNANYWLSNLAICCWLLPINTIARLLTDISLSKPVIIAYSSVSKLIASSPIKPTRFNFSEIALQVLIMLFLIGVLIASIRLLKFHYWRKQLTRSSKTTYHLLLSKRYNHPIYTSPNIEGAITLGIINPIIVMSEKVATDPEVELVILHEKQHIQNSDNGKLLFLLLMESIFWWNPLVRSLVKLNRFLIEVKCDQKVSAVYPNYVEGLSQLMLRHQRDKTMALSSNVLTSKNTNIHRIKLLKENRTMNLFNKAILISTFLSVATMMSSVTLATAHRGNFIEATDVDTKLGALINLDINLRLSHQQKGDEYTENTLSSKLTLWSKFDEPFSYQMEGYQVNLVVKDLGDQAKIFFDIIENENNQQKVVSSPQLTMKYGEQGKIEIDNPDVSDTGYAFSFSVAKAKDPSSDS
ncbi:M56 family metallopeptidase [Thalassotalea ganghwensis]